MNFLIVEDDNIQLTGLKHIIEEEYADAVVNTASTYNDAITIIDSFDIDIFYWTLISVEERPDWMYVVISEEFPNTMTHLSSSSPISPFQTLMSSTSIIASIISQSLMTESMS